MKLLAQLRAHASTHAITCAKLSAHANSHATTRAITCARIYLLDYVRN